MNIFMLHESPILSAKLMSDKHVPKMIVESAQILSTAHRVLDGIPDKRITKQGRELAYNRLPHDDHYYYEYNPNHPSCIWVRESVDNYNWLLATIDKLGIYLQTPPMHIPHTPQTSIPQVMPDVYQSTNPIDGYLNYYMSEKLFTQKDSDRFLSMIPYL